MKNNTIIGDELRIHEEIIKEALNDNSKPKQNKTFIFIVGVILALLVILMIIPFYAIKLDPRPEKIPTLDILNGFNLTNNNLSKNYTTSINHVWMLLDNTNVKQIAEKISLYSCHSYSDICYSKALFYFVRNNIQYVKDPVNEEYVKNPINTLVSKSGDCDDHAVLLASLLRSIGIPIRFVKTSNHIFLKIYIKDAKQKYKNKEGWIYLDPTCKNCEFGKISLDSYNEINSNI